MSDANDRRPRRHEKASWRQVDGEIFVTAPDGETVYTLTQVAASIWLLCDGTLSVAEMIEKLLVEFEIDRATLAADLDEFLEELSAEGLVI